MTSIIDSVTLFDNYKPKTKMLHARLLKAVLVVIK